MSDFYTANSNNLFDTSVNSAIAPWDANLDPTRAILPQLEANRALTGVGSLEVNAQSLTPDNSDNIILPDGSPSLLTNGTITNSNSSLSDSDVDVLIGQAMSEVHGDLSKFAAQANFVDGINLAFGENWDAAGAKALAEEWYKGDFGDIPPVKVVSSAEIGGANGAFAAATDTIYLSRELLAGGNLEAVADVLLEEVGHSVDARLNVTDSPGDEGAIFAAVLQGKVLSEGELQGLRSEDDSGTVLFNGQTISIEKANYDWGNRWYVQAFDTANSYKSLTEYDLGSNTRNDGKKGLVQDWGSSSPKPGIIPNDFFAVAFWTQADFQQGQTYNFNVRADDSYALAAVPVGAQDSNQWEFITQWKWNEDAYGGKTVQFQPKTNSKYWLLAYYRERDVNAYFDISWEKISNSSPVESNNNSQVYTAQAFVNSWQNLPEYTNRNPFPDKGQNCTWYAHGRMLQLGYSKAALDTMWGNAGTWDNTAKNGATVSNTPQAPSIAVWEPGVGGAGGVGHVAVVERVNSDGSILISESNWDKTQYNTRTISRNSRYWPSEFITVPKA